MVGQGEKLRLWVVADVGEVAGSQSFRGVLNKETEKFLFFYFFFFLTGWCEILLRRKLRERIRRSA